MKRLIGLILAVMLLIPVGSWAASKKGSDETLKTVPVGGDSVVIIDSADGLNKKITLGTIPLTGNAELKALTTGILKNTTTSGTPSIATAGTDYAVPVTATLANLAYSGSPITGKNIEASSTMAFGDVVVLVNRGANDVPCYRLAKADSDDSNLYPAVAMCVEATGIVSGATGAFLLAGFARNDAWTAMTMTDTPAALGDANTLWNVTNTAGTTYRYTYSSGTNPSLTSAKHGRVRIAAGTLATGNLGNFDITAGTNYFEVNNPSGVVESGKKGTFTYKESGSVWVSITGTTTNTLTQNKPVATGNIQMYLGCAIAEKEIYFNPSPVWNIAP